MKCLYCDKGETDVINSRKTKDFMVWRRRTCRNCSTVFTTSEHLSYDSLFVIKRNLLRKRFVYEKLFSSILIAITGQKGGDMGDDALKAKRITQHVITCLLSIKSKYFSTKEIIRVTHRFLEKEHTFYAQKYAMYSPYRLKVIKEKV